MVDNISVTPGSGVTVAADDVSGVLYQRVKQSWGVDGSATDVSATTPLPVASTGTYISVSGAYAARPANTTQYTPGDCWNQNTSPGSITFSNIAAVNNGGAVITDVHVLSSANQTATLPLSGELWLFDGSVALPSTTDNTSFTVTNAQYATRVAVIPFTLGSTGDPTAGTGNAGTHERTSITVQCASSSTSLLGLVKVTNAYTPVSGEILSFKLVGQR